jgi:hypothetical protein
VAAATAAATAAAAACAVTNAAAFSIGAHSKSSVSWGSRIGHPAPTQESMHLWHHGHDSFSSYSRLQ